jgi:hypothetical protein
MQVAYSSAMFIMTTVFASIDDCALRERCYIRSVVDLDAGHIS